MSDDRRAELPDNLRIAVLRLYGAVHEYRTRISDGDFDAGLLAKLDDLRNLVVHSTGEATLRVTSKYDRYMEAMLRAVSTLSPSQQVKRLAPPKEALFFSRYS